MQEGTKTFTHMGGVIILSKNQLVTDQLKENKNFYEPVGAIAKIHVFFSTDLIPEFKLNGLPLSVKKYLLSQGYDHILTLKS